MISLGYVDETGPMHKVIYQSICMIKLTPSVYKYLTFYRSHSHMFQTLKYYGISDVVFHKIDLQIFLYHSVKLYDSLAFNNA